MSFRLMLAAALTACSSATAVGAPKSVSIDFSKQPGPVTITNDGVEITLQPIKEDDDLIRVSAAVRVTGFQTVIAQEESASSAYVERVVQIVRLSSADHAASVLLQGFTGGAHCCATLSVVTPFAGRLKTIVFDEIDGGPDETLPKDIDGDGVVDIVRQDDSFRYQFASGAGSYSPPVIFNIYRGQRVDVSEQPTLRPFWEKFFLATKKACSDQNNDDRNGACAAYAAAGARLGRYEITFQDAVRLSSNAKDVVLPEPCKVDLVNYQCPEGKSIKFFTFESALRWFLQEHGYLNS